ncbi:hypothetical protein LTR17_005011 [Elasticomyces elasticus]|nr:hypothetical protein LTR17_005011 [Elasticomyces elasticus]
MSDETPSFDSLPLAKDGPHGNAWGRFGADNDLGMLNLLTPETTKAAAQEIRSGLRVSTDCPLDKFSEPFFGRAVFGQVIKNKAPRSVNDDTLTFNTQISSQWDGYRHYGYQNEQLYFNGHALEELLTTTKIGIHVWAANGGIVGRGVLLDYATWAERQGRSSPAFKTTPITVEELKQVAADQGTTFRKGDILLLRTGWMKSYNALLQQERKELAQLPSPPAIGIESSEATLRWLWDTAFAAIAGDQPSMEAWPCQNPEFWLHEWLLAGWGMPIGELFDLEKLAEEAHKCGRYTFMFSSVPLYAPGGVASPPNGVAIL